MKLIRKFWNYLDEAPAGDEEKRPILKILFGNVENRPFLITGILIAIAEFAIFKYFYPFASFIHGDSFVYLDTAFQNLDINTYPTGYSKFLRLFSVFNKSDTALVGFQYFLMMGSMFGLIFTLFHFYKPTRPAKIILWATTIFNPVFLYLSNYICSDALFVSLSMIWFVQLLWMLYKPTTKLILWNAVILFLAFTVRYNALFYPGIASITYVLTRSRIIPKVMGLALSIGLIGCFIGYTGSKYKALTGYRQFTPFTGWQLANNALYGYRYIDSASRKPVPKKFEQLDRMVREYFDSSRDVKKHPIEGVDASTFYMWSRGTPLQEYMYKRFEKDSTASDLKRWATVSPLFAEYGSLLMRMYPKEFFAHYIAINGLKYYAPPVEFLDSYNMMQDSVNPIAQEWFNYKSRAVKTRFKDKKVYVLNFYPILVGTMNVIFVLGLASFIFLGGYKEKRLLTKTLILIASMWLANFVFSVYASPIALRFQLFPILVTIAYAVLLVEFIVIEAFKKEPIPNFPESANIESRPVLVH